MDKQKSDERRRRIYINVFWVVLTVIIAICTVVVSISTIGDMLRTRSERRIVERKIAVLEKKIAEDSIFIEQITTSPEFMERFARENYNMQRPDETVYILEE